MKNHKTCILYFELYYQTSKGFKINCRVSLYLQRHQPWLKITDIFEIRKEQCSAGPP